MDFKIGELADILGVTREAIRHYERVGVIRPRRIKGNNYRVYSVSDVEHLLETKYLQSIGYSLDKSKEYLNLQDQASTAQQLADYKDKLRHRIEFLEFAIRTMERSIFYAEKAANIKEVCFLDTRPEFLRISVFGEKTTPEMGKLRKAWVAAMPWVSCSPLFRIREQDVLYEKGLCILKEAAERLSLSVNDSVEHYPARPSIYSLIDFDESPALSLDLFDHIMQFANKNNYTIDQDDNIIGRVYDLINGKGKKRVYYEVWIPVKKN